MKWILPLWCVVNVLLFSKIGIKVVADSERYLEYGRGLASGFYIDDFNIWYVGYALFIAVFYNVTAIVIAQYLLSLLALVALYKTSLLLFNSTKSAIATGVLFIAFFEISQWNAYVITESLFVSFTCFSLYLLASIHLGERRKWFLALTSFVILFTILIKPTGVALLAAVLAVTIKRSSLRIAVGVLFLLLLNLMLSNYNVIESYRKGEIIYAGLFIQTPPDLYNPPASYPTFIRIIAFIFHHPIYWATLFFTKIYYLLAHVRPFWSKAHNFFSVMALLVFYASFFTSIRRKGISRDVITFVATYLAIHILSIGFTTEDWDGRFLIPLLPVIIIFSGDGLTSWRYRKSSQ